MGVEHAACSLDLAVAIRIIAAESMVIVVLVQTIVAKVAKVDLGKTVIVPSPSIPIRQRARTLKTQRSRCLFTLSHLLQENHQHFHCQFLYLAHIDRHSKLPTFSKMR